MTSLAMPAADLFSIITIAEPGSRVPAWKSLLNWPRFGETHVDFATETPAQRNIWAARLDEAVTHADKPVLLIAGGESCFATAWWARLSPASYVSKVAGALLFAPSGPRVGAGAAEKFASPHIALPFPSAIVDPRASRQALALAEGWGSRLLQDGLHLESADPGAWQQAQAALMRLTARVVDRELRVATTLGVSL